jgi:hypothetical protein
MNPTIGRIVIYRSRTGDYDVPAIVTATTETLNPKGVELGHVPPLTSETHVHLTCFTPGKPGMRRDATDFKVESEHGRSENAGGIYQEWDIPFAGDEPATVGGDWVRPGTWRWPEIRR